MSVKKDDRIRITGPDGNEDVGKTGVVLDVVPALSLYPQRMMGRRPHERLNYTEGDMIVQARLDVDGPKTQRNFPAKFVAAE